MVFTFTRIMTKAARFFFCWAAILTLILVPFSHSARAEDPYDIGVFYFSDWNPEFASSLTKRTETYYGRTGDWFGGVKDHLTAPGPWAYGPFPDREPLLGWYDDRQQSVIDSHILQASSRGLDHFAFYYYWKDNGGGERPGQNIRQFQASPYKSLMNFYLYMIADGNWPASDWNSLMVPKLVSFMKDPSYKKTPDGRPIIGFMGDFAARLGGTAAWKQALAQLRTAARDAGLPNPLLLVNGYQDLNADIQQGYDGFLPLNLAGIGLDGSQGTPKDYSDSYPSAWSKFTASKYDSFLFIPGGISGFDPRPWRGIGYGDNDSSFKFSYSQPSPDKFRVQAGNVKAYLDSHPRSMNMATFYAWNELGEGGAIEPTSLFGYGYLNALQDVFHLDNSAYRTAASASRLPNLDPDLRLEFAPDNPVVTEGQTVKIRGKVTNQSSSAISGGTVSLDTGGWTVLHSSGADLKGLAAGAMQNVEFEIGAGTAEWWSKHPISVQAAYQSAGEAKQVTVSTFAVKVPDAYGIIRPVTAPLFSGKSVPLQVELRNYTSQSLSGHYRIDAPEGWKVSGGGEQDFTLNGGTLHPAPSANYQLTIPEGVEDGVYDLYLTVQTGGIETRSKISVTAGNYLKNSGFEIDSDGNGLADDWLAMNAKDTFTLSTDKQDGKRSQQILTTGYGGGIRQEWIALDPNRTYTLEAWVKVEKGTLSIVEAETDASFKNFLGSNLQKQVSNRTWQKVTYTFKPKANAANGSIRFLGWADGSTVAYVDHVVLR